MPGLNLNFLGNPHQRLATGKSLPTRQVEAIIVYGKPEQRVKVVEKILPNAFSLSTNHATSHLVMSVIEKCDNLVRTRLAYELRKKIPDMAKSKVSNSVLGALIDKVPATQIKEIAEEFTMSVDEDELPDACRHVSANNVIQKLLQHTVAAEVLVPRLLPHMLSLCTHPQGQHVVAKVIEVVVDGAPAVANALFPGGSGDDEVIELILNNLEESAVACALLKSNYIDDDIKAMVERTILNHATEWLSLETKKQQGEDEEAEPSFGPPTKTAEVAEKKIPTGRHNFLLSCALEHGTMETRKALFDLLIPHLPQMVHTKGQVQVVSMMIRTSSSSEQRQHILAALRTPEEGAATTIATSSSPTRSSSASPKGKTPKGKSSASASLMSMTEVACHQWRTIPLRTFIESYRRELPEEFVAGMMPQAVTLATDQCGSVVVQRLAEFSDDATRVQLYNAALPELSTLAIHPIGSYFVQILLETAGDDERRSNMANKIMEGLGDLRVGLSTAAGSRVMQKMAAYVTDEDLKRIVSAFASVEVEEEERLTEEQKKEKFNEVKHLDRKGRRDAFGSVRGGNLHDFALHPHACYVIRALLIETKRRQLIDELRKIMRPLQKHVFELAVSPWAGRIVLDVMLVSGSAKLTDAIRDVVFAKCEEWLKPSEGIGKRGGMDPTMRKALRGEHVSGDAPPTKKTRTEGGGNSSNTEGKEGKAATKPKSKKIYRSLKK